MLDMASRRVDAQRVKQFNEFGPLTHGERGAYADLLQNVRIVVETE